MKALYVTDRAAIGDQPFQDILNRLSGARELSVQLREKSIADAAYLDGARDAKSRVGPSVPLFVNRRFDIALAAGADGVHLPSGSIAVERVRAVTPRGFRIGISTHSAPEAARATETGADLIVIGPIFETPSKIAFGSPLGADSLAQLPRISEHESEVYAIGGVNEETLHQLTPYRDRITGVAAIRMFQEASDPRAVAEHLANL
jgi:thiamine-phosphate pyrophosphorylase